MFKILLEASLSGLEVIKWEGRNAVVLHRDAERVYLLVQGGPTIPVYELLVPDKPREPYVAIEYSGELRPAKVISRPSMFYAKGYEPPKIFAVAGGHKEDTHLVKKSKGDVGVRVRFMDWGTTSFIDPAGRTEQDVKTVQKDVNAKLPLLTIVPTKKFDEIMKPKAVPKPEASKVPVPERERVHQYAFDPASGSYIKKESLDAYPLDHLTISAQPEVEKTKPIIPNLVGTDFDVLTTCIKTLKRKGQYAQAAELQKRAATAPPGSVRAICQEYVEIR